MRCIATFVLAGTVIFSSSAFAGEGVLKPGVPAGVHQAQDFEHGTVLLAVGAMAAAASLALLISSTSGSGAPATAAGAGGSTSTSTSTSTTS
jgi:hypothetical protein